MEETRISTENAGIGTSHTGADPAEKLYRKKKEPSKNPERSGPTMDSGHFRDHHRVPSPSSCKSKGEATNRSW